MGSSVDEAGLGLILPGTILSALGRVRDASPSPLVASLLHKSKGIQKLHTKCTPAQW